MYCFAAQSAHFDAWLTGGQSPQRDAGLTSGNVAESRTAVAKSMSGTTFVGRYSGRRFPRSDGAAITAAWNRLAAFDTGAGGTVVPRITRSPVVMLVALNMRPGSAPCRAASASVPSDIGSGRSTPFQLARQ